MSKIIQEMLPDDIGCAKESRDIVVECCVGEYFSKRKKKKKRSMKNIIIIKKLLCIRIYTFIGIRG